MAHDLGMACWVLAVVCVAASPVAAQTVPEPTFVEDSKGCRLLNPWEKVDPSRAFVWSGECKDGLLSGFGVLTVTGTPISWKGNFKAGRLTHGVLHMGDGTIYEGDFKDNRGHGQGELRYTNGTVLSCTFTNGGSGPGPVKITRPDGSRYEGEYDHAKDVVEGRGKATQLNGATYEGEFHNGALAGVGVYKLANGDVYRGTFVNGQMNGSGDIVFAYGVKYRGQVQHSEPHGQGVMEYPDGTVYEGEFVTGRLEGPGVLRRANGDVLEARFHAGDAVGQGKQRYANGDVYEGEFLATLPQGAGKLTSWNGDLYEGQWKSGQLNGQCSIKTKNTLYQGECLNGTRSGRGHAEDFRDQFVYDGEFRDGMLHGQGVMQGKGFRYEGEFKAGAKARGKETTASSEYEGEFVDNLYSGQGRYRETSARGVEINYEGSFAAGDFEGRGVMVLAGVVRLEGEFTHGDFVRGHIEAGKRKLEVDIPKALFFEVLPDGTKRPITAGDLSELGIRS